MLVKVPSHHEDQEEEQGDVEDWSNFGEEIEVEEIHDLSGEDSAPLAEMITLPEQTVQLFFVVNGEKVYKTSCLKAKSSNNSCQRIGYVVSRG